MRPNILLIVSDDLGCQMGCFGDRQARTPVLDALSQTGVSWTQAYVTQPSCSPSRSSLLTGLYPHQNGQIGLSHLGYRMRSGLPNLPGLLKAAGYITGVIGKVHVEPEREFVFDYDYRHAVTGTRDIRWTNERVNEFICGIPATQPFFLYVNLFDPHRDFIDRVAGFPYRLTKPDDVTPFGFLGEAVNDAVRRDVAAFINSVSRVDTAVRLMMDTLERLGVMRNTLCVFLGDNGAPFTRGKTTCYEAGVHVPLICWGYGVRAQRPRHELVSTVDIMPTLLDFAEAAVPAQIEGRSLRPALEGRSYRGRRTLCVEHTAHQPSEYYPRRAIRDTRYKLILNLRSETPNPVLGIDGCAAWEASRAPRLAGSRTRQAFDVYHHPPQWELYDLVRDPDEFENLAEDPAHARVLRRLQVALNDWRVRTRDPLLNPETLHRLNEAHDRLRAPGSRWDPALTD